MAGNTFCEYLRQFWSWFTSKTSVNWGSTNFVFWKSPDFDHFGPKSGQNRQFFQKVSLKNSGSYPVSNVETTASVLLAANTTKSDIVYLPQIAFFEEIFWKIVFFGSFLGPFGAKMAPFWARFSRSRHFSTISRHFSTISSNFSLKIDGLTCSTPTSWLCDAF